MLKPAGKSGLSWLEYKTVRQFQSMGEILDEFKVYGFRGGVESVSSREGKTDGNGYNWLTEDRGR